jgi:uncharacterized protein (DUF302 family)
MGETKNVTIKNIEIERFSVTSSKPFEAVVAALEAAVGTPDMVEFAQATRAARTLGELARTVQAGLGRTGLMMFMKLDHGAVLSKETGSDRPRIMRFVIGNPLIMKDMVKHVPDAGSYAPVTILVDERSDGVHFVVRQDDKFPRSLWKRSGSYCCRGARFKNREPNSRICDQLTSPRFGSRPPENARSRSRCSRTAGREEHSERKAFELSGGSKWTAL